MKCTCTALVLLLVVILLATASPILASPPDDAPSSSLLLTFTSPAFTPALSAGGAAYPFSARADEDISRVIPILNSLKKHGHLRSFELVSGANAIRLDTPDSQAMLLLHGLPGVAGLAPATAENVQTAQSSFRTVLSRAASAAVPAMRRMQGNPPVTDPPVTEVNETWDTVQGKNFIPGDGVTAVLKDSGGNQKATVTATVNSDGQFRAWFSPADVVQGDSVEVQVGSSYAETIHSIAITIDFDYDHNQVTGTVASGENVLVHVRGGDRASCQYYDDQTVKATLTGGNYIADLSSASVHLNRQMEADVSSYVPGVSGSLGWVVWRHAPWVSIQLDPGNNNGNGNALGPKHDLTITLSDALGVKETVKLKSNYPDAGFGFRFDRSDILPGDTIDIAEDTGSGTVNWPTITIQTLSTYLDPGTNLITGSRPAGQPVTVAAQHYNRSNGQWEGQCQVVPSGGSTYSQNFGVDYVAGDHAEAYLVFDQGNELRIQDNAPYLLLYKDQNIVEGTFHSNFDGEMTIVVKTALGVVKYSGKGYAFGGWWQQILAKGGLPVKLATNDLVTVTPALPTKGTLTGKVAKLTASISKDAQGKTTINGTSPVNAYLGVFNFYWDGWNYNCNQCFWIAHAGTTGGYSFTFDRDWASGDYVDAYYVDKTGHRTIARGFSTNPTMTLKGTAPTIFRRGRPNNVIYTISNGAHVREIYAGLDGVSHPDWNYTMRMGPNYDWRPGSYGDYTMEFWFGAGGRVYYRGFAWVDGRFIFTSPELWAPVR